MRDDTLLCYNCTRYHLDEMDGCDAFPEGIPSDILSQKVKHTTPYKGDNGLLFVPIVEVGWSP